MEPVLLMSAWRHPTIFPANASISDASSARSESEGSIKGSIPIARWRSCKFAQNKNRRFAGFCRALGRTRTVDPLSMKEGRVSRGGGRSMRPPAGLWVWSVAHLSMAPSLCGD
jgi:hypothetical protein